jgi:arylsulfatase A-like enzyme
MPERDPPNIVLITTDQQRYDTLGATGDDWIRTPTLDALAERGTLFERAYVQNPVCIPSRACLQTGRYTHQHGVEHMETEIDETPGLPEWERTFVERLQEAGYRTGATGKLHMMPPKGFHYERLSNGKGARWRTYEGSDLGQGPLGKTYAAWLERRHPGGYEAIYEQRRGDAFEEYGTAVTNVLPAEEYVDYWVADEAVEFLHDPHSDPFFLWCGFMSPHDPVDPPEPYDSMYAREEVGMPERRQDADDPASPKGQAEPWWGDDPEKIERWRAHYFGLVSFVDDMVERIVETLRERDLLEETLIVFTSDHGEMAGDYNLMAKGNFYEEVIRVPTIVVPPGGSGVDRFDGLVEVADLAPTILDYAGVPRPDVMPTRSLRPVLEGERDDHRESVLCEYATNDRSRKSKCVRTERYKYVFHAGDADPEFYDLREDPDELVDRHDDPAYREELSRHRELLLDRLTRSEQRYHVDETPRDRDLRTWLE